MPDLSIEGAHHYWFRFKDQSVYTVINIMESIEQWTLDGDPDLEKSLHNLGQALENTEQINLKHQEEFIQIAAYLKISRTLRILQALDTAYPSAAAKLIAYAETQSDSSPHAKTFLSRNVVFERLRVLSRVLAPDRLILVQSAIEEFKHG
ncbi:MAG: phosphoesterase [Legionellales bacterium]|nr:phosphoesterase [Legionellales bacterium]|tara:strand:+ start:57 stop:506 length:450 start_codon:yes stop_codon:yes gene_type:complete